jgi:hypothetical protein
MRGMS